MKNYWTKTKVEKLSKLWGQGVSARDIATKLGDISRNAVIGKANRLGLSKKLSSEDKTIKKEINAASLVPNMNGCKWPIGHPGDNDFYFCGKPVIPGKPYCGEHCLIAYRRKDSHQKVKKFFKLNSEA
ncbi:MAG: global cell cycle regulator GcrA-like protein [Alphaproteobacteria bacterium TMED194]|nr:MAG: global cell cycle regulator GcrA-like protein [Alphaproteobacteria bacterium TMED194]|tara:strand:- start:301 stop:684 length:384 start_codon:yes stop_codon:yes gene_type:complete